MKHTLPPSASIDRRRFLSGTALAAATGLTWPSYMLADESTGASDRHGLLLPTRPFGRTGERICMLGLGGQHFRRLPEGQQAAAIEAAIEGGIRFFDTAAAYGRNQLAERLYGEHLTPRYREAVFLMTKSSARQGAQAQEQLDRSLKNMKTDVIDLWQIHTLETVADVDRRWDNGVIDVFLKAREDGMVRYIGITGHKEPEVMLHMLNRFIERGIPLEAIQMPVNVCDPVYSSFIKKVMPLCLEHDIAVLAMKTMCGGRLFGGIGEGWGPRGQVETESVIPDALRFRDATDYVWSLPIASRIAGFDTITQLKENIAAARHAGAVPPERRKQILTAAADHAGPVREYYKRNLLPSAHPKEKNF